VARLADAENLEVDPTRPRDRVLVATTLIIDILARLRRRAACRRCGVDIDVREQILPHEAPVGVDAVRRIG
jgi:hypothetical protein